MCEHAYVPASYEMGYQDEGTFYQHKHACLKSLYCWKCSDIKFIEQDLANKFYPSPYGNKY